MPAKIETTSQGEVNTFDDYIRIYFPSLATGRRNADLTDPYKIGVEMAKDALGKFGTELTSKVEESA